MFQETYDVIVVGAGHVVQKRCGSGQFGFENLIGYNELAEHSPDVV